MSEKLAPDGFVFEDGEDFDEPCPICGALHPDSCDEMTHEDAGFAHSLAVAGQTDAALHFEHQRARLAELERLLTADGKKPVAVELVG